MFQRFCIILFMICFVFCAGEVSSNEVNVKYIYPPEWDPHETVWMGFRTFEDGLRYKPLLDKMLATLSQYVPVKIVVEDISLLHEGKDYFRMNGIDPDRVDIAIEESADFWFRDPGPIFLTSEHDGLAVADFLYSNYANVPPESFSLLALRYEKIDEHIAKRLSLPLIESKIVLEGGAFEVNGKGTVLLASSTLERNPGLTKAQIEEEVIRTLGQKKVIWLKDGLSEDPLGFKRITGKYWGRGAGGHTDEFVRFVNQNTILLAWVSESEREDNAVYAIDYERMVDNYNILLKATDQDGKPFKIIKFPVPPLVTEKYSIKKEEAVYFQRIDPRLKEGNEIILVAAASYLNYILTNGIVMMPKYATAGSSENFHQKDNEAKNILKKFFSGRDIVQINPTSLNFHGGGMHCILVQQPARMGQK